MPHADRLDINWKAPPFDRFTNIQRLATDRSGHASVEHVRHHLYVARDKQSRGRALIKLTAKPGLVYQHNLLNEIATLSTINRELPDSRHFPLLFTHGRLDDGRVFLAMSLFDEFPLATSIGSERVPGRLVGHLRTALAVANALAELHRLAIFHVDLNPMNILHRTEAGRPVVRIVDFESSYERGRHGKGEFYSPPTTTGYSAPEVAHQAPDARADVFSLGAVLYTMVAGFEWTWDSEVGPSIESDRDLDAELKRILLTAVHRSPDGRYPSIDDLRTDLGAYLEQIWPGRSW